MGEVVRGTGPGVKDVVHPPVEVDVASDLSSSGIKILQGHEGDASGICRRSCALFELQLRRAHPARERDAVAPAKAPLDESSDA